MMTVLAILVVATALLGLAYRFYGSLLARRVMQLDDSRPTPARTMRDDRDYVPTHPAVLFGHHFASIAGLGPLLGPAIAVIWGWLPALIWILLGSIFVGAVHDFGCLLTSIRHKARSIGDITEEVMSHMARILFLLFAIFAMSLAMGVFVLNIAQLFSPGEGGAESGHVPEAVLPSLMLIVIAITAGILRYRFNFDLLPLTIIGVAASLFFCLAWDDFPTQRYWRDCFHPIPLDIRLDGLCIPRIGFARLATPPAARLPQLVPVVFGDGAAFCRRSYRRFVWKLAFGCTGS
jgi:carbon starvation protein